MPCGSWDGELDGEFRFLRLKLIVVVAIVINKTNIAVC